MIRLSITYYRIKLLTSEPNLRGSNRFLTNYSIKINDVLSIYERVKLYRKFRNLFITNKSHRLCIGKAERSLGRFELRPNINFPDTLRTTSLQKNYGGRQTVRQTGLHKAWKCNGCPGCQGLHNTGEDSSCVESRTVIDVLSPKRMTRHFLHRLTRDMPSLYSVVHTIVFIHVSSLSYSLYKY